MLYHLPLLEIGASSGWRQCARTATGPSVAAVKMTSRRQDEDDAFFASPPAARRDVARDANIQKMRTLGMVPQTPLMAFRSFCPDHSANPFRLDPP